MTKRERVRREKVRAKKAEAARQEWVATWGELVTRRLGASEHRLSLLEGRTAERFRLLEAHVEALRGFMDGIRRALR